VTKDLTVPTPAKRNRLVEFLALNSTKKLPARVLPATATTKFLPDQVILKVLTTAAVGVSFQHLVVLRA
jgi:hypothetical protein